MKKITSFLMLFLMGFGMAWAQNPKQITALTEALPNMSYTLTAKAGLCVDIEGDAATVLTNTAQKGNASAAMKQFAFVSDGQHYYLYSVGAQKYVGNDGKLSALPMHAINFEKVQWNNADAVKVNFGAGKVININGANNTVVDGWNNTDAGNSFKVVEAGEISPVLFAPFVVSTPEKMVWHVVKMPAADHRFMQVSGVDLHVKTSVTQDKSHLFAFMKDEEGFQVYNYAVKDKVLGVANGSDGTPVKMVAKNSANTHWEFGTNGDGFYIKNKVSETAYVNRYGGGNNSHLKIWANNAAAADKESRFVFEEVDQNLPEIGKKYYLFSDHQQGKQYFYDNNGQMGWAAEADKVANDRKYVWTCTLDNNGKYVLRNYGTGQYFGWQSISSDPFGWVLSSKNQVVHPEKKNVSMFSTTVPGKTDGRFLVVTFKNNQWSFNQSTHSENSGEHGSDFHFEECNVNDNDFITTPVTEFFADTYGQKLVRLNFFRDVTYGAEAGAEGAKNLKANYGEEAQVWSLVGTSESFKLFNTEKGETVALSVDNANDAAVATFVDQASACSWKLVAKDFGSYAVVPNLAKTDNTERSLNSFGGVGGQLKLHQAGDAGGWWRLQVVEKAFMLKNEILGENPYPVNNNRAGDLKLTVNGKASWSTISAAGEMTYYLPAGADVVLEQSFEYRGFKKGGFLVDNVEQSSVAFQLGAEGQPAQIVSNFVVAPERGQYLYKTPGKNGHPYRIPAIMTALNGHIIAISDFRPAGADIGYGEVDIKCRISTDNGQTWGEEFFIADGHGKADATNKGPWDYGFGDAAIVADCERNEVLIMMVCGKTVCWNGEYDPNDPTKVPNRVAMVRGHYDETQSKWVFTQPVEVTDRIYPLFVKDGKATVQSLFIGSGRIMQSRVTKVDKYYRLYCSTWTKNEGNRVIYSDDFGETWKVLGGVDARPGKGGDEPKCEELPNGDVILSSRRNGRLFNIYRFTNKETGEGSWGVEQHSEGKTGGIVVNNSTNGEIMLFNAIEKATQKKVVVAIQSTPFGSGRNNVGVFFKEITPNLYDRGVNNNKCIEDLASDWTKGLQISYTGSAYSTMTLQKDHKIGFFFEENPGDYSMVYIPLTLDEMTGDKYTIDTEAYGDLTGIENIEVEGVGVAPLYDMSGRRVAHVAKDGVYIQNGKKFIVK